MQNYANHKQYVPMFHGVLLGLLLLTLIGASVNLYKSLGDHERIYSASLILVLAILVFMVSFFARIFALGELAVVLFVFTVRPRVSSSRPPVR